MYYGLTLTRKDGVVIHTTDEDNPSEKYQWHLVPTSRPLINPPEVKTEYVDIPGANGSLDYTEILSGAVHYGMREGSWEFMVLNDKYAYYNRNGTPDNGWWKIYHEILEEIHGKYFSKIELESEPDRVYSGRLFVESWVTEKEYSKVTIKYKINPMTKPKTVEVIDNSDPENPVSTEVRQVSPWLWDDLFTSSSVNPIEFGPFNVSGTLYRTIVNSESTDQVVTFNCSSAINGVKYGIIFNCDSNGNPISIDETQAQTVNLAAGNTSVTIPPGETVFKFVSEGLVSVEMFYGNKGASL